MQDEVLGSLLKDHESMRAIRRMLVNELRRAARCRNPDRLRLRRILGYAMHDPASYHHLFEGHLTQRLIERWGGAEPVARSIQRQHDRLGAVSNKLHRAVAHAHAVGLVQRVRMARLARRYAGRHEALLQAEEARLFPLFRDVLVPADWVEATTAFEWSLVPDMPRHLIASRRDRGDAVAVPRRRGQQGPDNDSVA